MKASALPEFNFGSLSLGGHDNGHKDIKNESVVSAAPVTNGVTPSSVLHRYYARHHVQANGNAPNAQISIPSSGAVAAAEMQAASPLSKLKLDTNVGSISSPLNSGNSGMASAYASPAGALGAVNASNAHSTRSTPSTPFQTPYSAVTPSTANSLSGSILNRPRNRYNAAGGVASSQTNTGNSTASSPASKRGQRNLPTFNVIAIGPSRTGKTGFLKTFLTSLAPNAIGSHAKDAMDQIRSFGLKSDDSSISHLLDNPDAPLTDTCTLDVFEQGRKVRVSAIDTPGLQTGDIDTMRTQVIQLINFIESKFEETLSWETKVYRSTKKAVDAHIHMVLYFLHPDSLVANCVRPGETTKSSSSSSSAKSHRSRGRSTSPQSNEDDRQERLMSLKDIHIIKELSKRVNVIPVIGRADELTNAQSRLAKELVNDAMKLAGIRVDEFDKYESTESEVSTKRSGQRRDHKSSEEDEEEPRVVKVNTRRLSMSSTMSARRRRALSRSEPNTPSRSTHDDDGEFDHSAIGDFGIDGENEEEPLPGLPLPPLAELCPFTIITPDEFDEDNCLGEITGSSKDAADDDVPLQLFSRRSRSQSIAAFGRNKLFDALSKKGPRYTRSFRFGEADVMNPDHCDFKLLKRFLFSDKLESLKDWTTERYYEEYRTERLLRARKLKQQQA